VHTAPSGATYVTDAPAESGAGAPLAGPTPMELLLGAVGGCTGVDLVRILTKMRVAVKRLRVTLDGERAAEHPRVYAAVAIRYELETNPVDPRKVRRAVELSAKKYCGAAATLAAVGRVTYHLTYAGETIEGEVPQGSRRD